MQILNIGLTTKHGGTLRVNAVTAQLIGRAITAVYCGTHQSASEPTAVYVIDDASPVQLYAIAQALAQDAIAAYNPRTERGRLWGPDAAAWGEFDPALFIMPNGLRLGAE